MSFFSGIRIVKTMEGTYGNQLSGWLLCQRGHKLTGMCHRHSLVIYIFREKKSTFGVPGTSVGEGKDNCDQEHN